MKTLLIVLFSIITLNLFAQDWENDERKDRHHKHDEYKRDFYTVGLYSGSYIGLGSQSEKNFYFNSIAAEIEYVKFRDLSLYARGIYQFSDVSEPLLYIPNSTYEQPFHYKMIISFGGRYYVRKEGKVRPYLQLGINQETQFQKETVVKYTNPDGTESSYTVSGGGYNFYYFMNIGIGFNVKISKRFNIDFKYDLNKSIERKVSGFNGFSVLAGLKYNL